MDRDRRDARRYAKQLPAPSPKTFSHLQRLIDQKLARLRMATHIFTMLPDEQSTPEQIAIYRQMTPERRLSLAEQLYWSAREIKAAWLRAQHADWSEEQIACEVTRAFTNART